MSILSNFSSKVLRLSALVLIVVGLSAPAIASVMSQPRDGNSNSIMFNGAYTKSEWLGKVNSGDTVHSAANLQQIFYNEGRGITAANFSSSSTVDGTVFKDGHIEINGKTVAIGARSIGRSFMAGSTKSGSVWERPTSISFTTSSIPAFVNTEGGIFRYAIVKSCGNSVRATSTIQPAPIVTPTPTPTPTPVPIPAPAPAPAPIGQVLSANLPDTGPETALGSASAATAIMYASSAYLRSRKSVLNALRGNGGPADQG